MNYKLLGFCSIIVAGATILYFFNPEKTILLPKCPIYILTGFKCPSCGTQRAIYYLLHLNIQKAFLYNIFLLISAPYATALVIVSCFDPKGKLSKLKKICYTPITVYIFLFLYVLWGIARNFINT